MKLTDFFENEYLTYGSYENFRSIASYVDGNNNVKRKIFHTALNKGNFKMRVDLFANEVIAKSKYIHGSCDDSVVGLVSNYVGSNNIPLFKGLGDFGSRLTGGVSAATRYISIATSHYLNLIYKKEDNDILIKQRFEGYDVEPKYYVPIIPILLVNGSNSPSIGFSHKVFPRNINNICQNIFNYLDNKPLNEMLPYYNGFKGTIEKGIGERQFIIKGVCEVVNTSTVKITELPLGPTMLSYRDFLKNLKTNKKIVNFKVNNDTKKDTYEYEIKFERKVLSSLTENKLYEYLNLRTTTSEILFLNNENNKIIEFNNTLEILQAYIKIRLDYYVKRKEYLINKMKLDITILENRIKFINDILNDVIIFKGKKKTQIEKQLKDLNYYKDESYDYLLNMNIHSLTEDKISDLENRLSKLMKELEDYLNKDVTMIWKEELNNLLVALGEKKLRVNQSRLEDIIKPIDNINLEEIQKIEKFKQEISNELAIPKTLLFNSDEGLSKIKSEDIKLDDLF